MTIQFVEVDAQNLYNNLIIQFQSALDQVLYPGDERRIFLEQETQILVALYNAINETGKQNLLRYARGELLDAIGERTNTPRLKAKKASSKLRFTLSTAQPVNITIPAGTRGTPDGTYFFSTKTDLVILAGQTHGDTLAEAAEVGQAYNGFTTGQINQLVDALPYVASIANIDTSAGGADVEPDDDGVNVWSGYRERIREAPSKFSTAGPEDGYIYWAKTASQDIIDVVPTSPAACQVKITVLMKNGEMPTQQILDAVLAICSDKKIRPQTDLVTASAPSPINYGINFTYYISEERSTEESTIRNAIEGTGGVVDKYKYWQCTKLGRAINPDELRKLALNAGASRLEIVSPVFNTIAKDAVAQIGAVTVTYGGLE